jgi:hypothetical protein
MKLSATPCSILGEDQPVGTMFRLLGYYRDHQRRYSLRSSSNGTSKTSCAGHGDSIVRAHSEPIRNPVTDREEQMIWCCPGLGFHEAENAAGFAKGLGAIKFDLNGRHSSLAHIAGTERLLHTDDEYKLKFGRP